MPANIIFQDVWVWEDVCVASFLKKYIYKPYICLQTLMYYVMPANIIFAGCVSVRGCMCTVVLKKAYLQTVNMKFFLQI